LTVFAARTRHGPIAAAVALAIRTLFTLLLLFASVRSVSAALSCVRSRRRRGQRTK
jgi:hypothetical protein